METVRFKSKTQEFRSHKETEREETLRFHFDERVRRAEAALQGFQAAFDNGNHPVDLLYHRITDVDHDEHEVKVTVKYGFKDSGRFDDPYSGRVDVLVIAVTEHEGAPTP